MGMVCPAKRSISMMKTMRGPIARDTSPSSLTKVTFPSTWMAMRSTTAKRAGARRSSAMRYGNHFKLKPKHNPENSPVSSQGDDCSTSLYKPKSPLRKRGFFVFRVHSPNFPLISSDNILQYPGFFILYLFIYVYLSKNTKYCRVYIGWALGCCVHPRNYQYRRIRIGT